MQLSRVCNRGISPIIAILILIAVTIVITGAAAIWFFGFANVDTDNGGDKIYVFHAELDGGEDELKVSIISGGLLNTSKMIVKIDENQLTIPVEVINAGSEIAINSTEDLEIGSTYNVKIIINNKLYYENDLVAAP